MRAWYGVRVATKSIPLPPDPSDRSSKSCMGVASPKYTDMGGESNARNGESDPLHTGIITQVVISGHVVFPTGMCFEHVFTLTIEFQYIRIQC